MTGPIVSELRRAGAAETEPGTTLRPGTGASPSGLIAQPSFGFERAFADWAGDDSAVSAHARLETLVVERTKRVAGLERDAPERDPVVGAEARTLVVVGGRHVLGCFLVCALAPEYTTATYSVGAAAVLFIAAWFQPRERKRG